MTLICQCFELCFVMPIDFLVGNATEEKELKGSRSLLNTTQPTPAVSLQQCDSLAHNHNKTMT